VTDDTAAFQAAGNALGVGGVIFIPQGSYLITDRLVFDNRVVLRGERERQRRGGVGMVWSGAGLTERRRV
jgi:hypothetical protein